MQCEINILILKYPKLILTYDIYSGILRCFICWFHFFGTGCQKRKNGNELIKRKHHKITGNEASMPLEVKELQKNVCATQN